MWGVFTAKLKKNKVSAEEFEDSSLFVGFGRIDLVLLNKDKKELGIKELKISPVNVDSFKLITADYATGAVNGIAKGIVTTTILGPIGLLDFKNKCLFYFVTS